VDYKQVMIPAMLFLIGLVMLMGGGTQGVRLGGKILGVILGSIAFFLVFGFIVGRAI
jgi:hypothetical protein